MKKTLLSLFLFFALFFNAKAQLTVTNAPPYDQASYLVQNILLGQGVTVSNITYTGDPAAIGFFQNGLTTNPTIGIDSGLIICSGPITVAPGPTNTNPAAGADNGQPGDVDLSTIVNPNMTFNAAILEFDFITYADTVKFDFVFASEEYPEYTCCSVNDVFGFFISGPGINGPYTNNAENIALIPNTTTPIQINTVNGPYAPVSYCDATAPCCGGYPQFYVDNSGWTNPPTNLSPTSVEYDGFTTVLTAISPVQCGQVYHIKIAISDVGDGIFDSGVFLKAGSFSASGILVDANISYGGPNDSTLFEGCGTACLLLTRSGDLSSADTVALTIGGQAVNGVDYTPSLPSQVIFQPGDDTIQICITALNENVLEGLELVSITATSNTICTQSNSAVLEFYVGDYTPLNLAASSDTTICPNTQLFLNAQASGGVQPYSYSWSTGSNNQTIIVTPTANTSYTVTVTDSCNSPVQTQIINVIVAPTGPAITTPDYTVCEGEQITINMVVSGGAPSFSCNWTTISGNDTIPQTVCNSSYSYTPTSNGTFLVSITDGCSRTDVDTISVVIETDCSIIVPNVFTPNGDGINDFFSFENLENFPGSRFVVYNRWGNIIYDDASYQNNWSGDNHSDGTYYFILYLPDGKTIPGYLTLLRKK